MALKDSETDVDRAFNHGDLRGLATENAFGGALSFLRHYTKDRAGVDPAVMGIPFDQAVTNRPGARFGPIAIREASALQPCDPLYGWGFDPRSQFAIVDYGDLAFDYGRVDACPAVLADQSVEILVANVGTISFWGDHYFSYPTQRTYAEKYGPLALIQFDAHTDTWSEDDLDRICHRTMFYKAVKQRPIVPEHSVQIGIWTEIPDALGIDIIDVGFAHEMGPGAVAQKLKDIVGYRPCHLSFDIDCSDPAFALGTGTLVWGGLHSWQASAILRESAGINPKGGDLVEVASSCDVNGGDCHRRGPCGQ